MAWVEAHGGGYRVRYRLPDGKVGSEPGFATQAEAERRALELTAPRRTPARASEPKNNTQAGPPRETPLKTPSRAVPAPKHALTDAPRPTPAASNRTQQPIPAASRHTASTSARPRRVTRIFKLHDLDDAAPPARPPRFTSTPTLEQWVRAWAPTHRISANTAASYDNALRIHILPALGHLPIDEIDRLDVKAFAQHLGTRMRPTSVHTVITTLSVVMNEAVHSRLAPANPCRRLRLPPREPDEKVIATPVQILQIAARLEPLTALMAITGAYTGMRWGELAGLQWTNVHLDHATPHITIPKDDSALHEIAGRLTLGPPKTRAAARDIALPQHVAELLTTAHDLAKSPFVFTSPTGTWLRRNNFRRREWQPALDGVPTHPDPARRTSIAPGMTFHALRHCHKTWMTEDQILESIQNYRLGHATPGIGARYNHPNLDMQKDVTTRMDQRYTQSTHDYTHLSPALPSLPPRNTDQPPNR